MPQTTALPCVLLFEWDTFISSLSLLEEHINDFNVRCNFNIHHYPPFVIMMFTLANETKLTNCQWFGRGDFYPCDPFVSHLDFPSNVLTSLLVLGSARTSTRTYVCVRPRRLASVE